MNQCFFWQIFCFKLFWFFFLWRWHSQLQHLNLCLMFLSIIDFIRLKEWKAAKSVLVSDPKSSWLCITCLSRLIPDTACVPSQLPSSAASESTCLPASSLFSDPYPHARDRGAGLTVLNSHHVLTLLVLCCSSGNTKTHCVRCDAVRR